MDNGIKKNRECKNGLCPFSIVDNLLYWISKLYVLLNPSLFFIFSIYYPVRAQLEALFILFEKMSKLNFVMAKLFLAVCTGKARVCVLGKSFGMDKDRKLPANKKQERNSEKRPRVNVFDKNEGSKHHCVIPIVDTAASAALVFHKPSLKRAEKEDTDHIADRIEKADEEKYSAINDICKIKRADRPVKQQPDERHEQGRFPRLPIGRIFIGFYKVFFKPEISKPLI